jgi:GNAT superfamily N-acetyltransferase
MDSDWYARQMVKMLADHYHVPEPRISMSFGNIGQAANYDCEAATGGVIRVPEIKIFNFRDSNLEGLIAHEFAHHLDHVLRGAGRYEDETTHDDRFYNLATEVHQTLRKLYTYEHPEGFTSALHGTMPARQWIEWADGQVDFPENTVPGWIKTDGQIVAVDAHEDYGASGSGRSAYSQAWREGSIRFVVQPRRSMYANPYLGLEWRLSEDEDFIIPTPNQRRAIATLIQEYDLKDFYCDVNREDGQPYDHRRFGSRAEFGNYLRSFDYTKAASKTAMASDAWKTIPDLYFEVKKNTVSAYLPEVREASKMAIGRIYWYPDGEIMQINVRPEYQRMGLATELFRRAKEVKPDLHHSKTLSDQGRAWSEVTAKTAAPFKVKEWGDWNVEKRWDYANPSFQVIIEPRPGAGGGLGGFKLATLKLPFTVDPMEAIQEVTEAAKRDLAGKPPAWSDATFHLKGGGDQGWILMTAPDANMQWGQPKGYGHDQPLREFYDAWRQRDNEGMWYSIAVNMARIVPEKTPGSFDRWPTLQTKPNAPHIAIVYRGISLPPGADPTTAAHADTGGTGYSWSTSEKTAMAIAERGMAGFEGQNVPGRPSQYSPSKPYVPTVLRAEIDMNSPATLYTSNDWRYLSEQEIDIPKGTPLLMTGWKQAKAVPLDRAQQRAVEANPEPDRNTATEEDWKRYWEGPRSYQVRWQWGPFKTVRVQRTAVNA